MKACPANQIKKKNEIENAMMKTTFDLQQAEVFSNITIISHCLCTKSNLQSV